MYITILLFFPLISVSVSFVELNVQKALINLENTTYSTYVNDQNHVIHKKSQVEFTNNNITNNIHAQDNIDFNEFDEATNFGLRAMYELFEVEERKLYELGLTLEPDHPAQYVAAFNHQSDEAKNLSKIAYAALKGSKELSNKYKHVSKDILLNIFKEDVNVSQTNRRVSLRERCPRSDHIQCSTTSLKYRTADGSCNNFKHPWWGSAMSTMQRFLDPFYDDGIETIRKSKHNNPLPSPRDVSSTIHRDKDIPLASLTHMLMQWGQFIDHDMIATAQSKGFQGSFPQCCRNSGTEFQRPELMHPDCLPIPVSPDDEFFKQFRVRCLEFVRSGPAPRNDCGFGPREQLSQVSSFLDGSMIYSSNIHHSDSLRLFRNGLLQYGKLASQKPILPRGELNDLCRRGSLSTNCFKAGDARLSEQPALTSLHVIFLRLHNKIAMELTALNPHWNDERLFQESRKIVGAVIQHITYHEFLPIVLGSTIMKIFGLELKRTGYYDGYDPTINPTIANSFATAAYRFGHSLVQRGFFRYDNQHKIIFQNVTIHQEFNNRVDLHSAGSVDRLLLGLVNQPSQRRDEFITSELTNHLFQLPSFPFGMDLASINIQRGRDHGLPPYVYWRKPCGLSSILTWQDLERSTSFETAKKFRKIYSDVEDIDLFPAGLAEKPVPGGLVGPTFACIIAQQFSNLRKGDRFWYENGAFQNSFSPLQLDRIRRITLAQILCQTLDNIDTIQPFAFLTPDIFKNKRISCNDKRLNELNFDPWIESIFEKNASTSRTTNNAKLNVTKLEDRQKMFSISNYTYLYTPIKTDVKQKNRVVIKKPIGQQQENLTINVQNHAVNSPIFFKSLPTNQNNFSFIHFLQDERNINTNANYRDELNNQSTSNN
ncbi:chorion peroxidase-like [Chelonus insularis]|uniref:chorion peroxidase-like n=1 Tax=Chelonus insularis TaxID=460826 RepID=UPI00158F179F|nr:chorion peroxidase-like [Chelonus insularis]